MASNMPANQHVNQYANQHANQHANPHANPHANQHINQYANLYSNHHHNGHPSFHHYHNQTITNLYNQPPWVILPNQALPPTPPPSPMNGHHGPNANPMTPRPAQHASIVDDVFAAAEFQFQEDFGAQRTANATANARRGTARPRRHTAGADEDALGEAQRRRRGAVNSIVEDAFAAAELQFLEGFPPMGR